MKNKFDLNEIESDEAYWHLNRFYRDMWILSGVVALTIILGIIL